MKFGRLSMTVRMPFFVAIMFLIFSAALISLAMHGLTRQLDRQIEDLGQVYLDGLSAALLPSVRQQDIDGVRDTLNRALETHVGVIDRTLAVLGADHRLQISVSRSDESGPIPAFLTTERPLGTHIVRTPASAWSWRPLSADAPELGFIMANLDVEKFMAQRRELALELTLLGLLITLLGTALAVFVARRLQRPLMDLTARLRAAKTAIPAPMDLDRTDGDRELTELFSAYNWMVRGAHEREDLAQGQARLEREAILGRMSAALAHEIRNPLGGMRTSVQTLRQFGDDARVRQESLDFVDRGLIALEGVVSASLRTFRSDEQLRLTIADIQDLQVLAGAEAARRAVRLDVQSTWPEGYASSLAATPLRQLLLNLALNAIEASPSGATIQVRSTARARALVLHVLDAGSGMPVDDLLRLTSEPHTNDAAPSERTGLGLGIVRDLVQQMAGRLRVTQRVPGTLISIYLPHTLIKQTTT